MRSDGRTRTRLRALARRERNGLERRLRVLIPAMLREVDGSVSRAELANAALFGAGHLEAAKARLLARLRDWRGRLVAALTEPVQKAADRPPPVNQRRLAELQVGQLIRELSEQQLATVQAQLAQVARYGARPDRLEAIADTTGLTARQAEAVAATYERARAAGYAEVVALRVAAAQRERLMRYRSGLIARTEATRLANGMVAERGRALGAEGQPRLKLWLSARDEDVDEVCQGLDNGQAIPLDARFPGGYDQPPAHPGCRCLLELVEPV